MHARPDPTPLRTSFHEGSKTPQVAISDEQGSRLAWGASALVNIRRALPATIAVYVVATQRHTLMIEQPCRRDILRMTLASVQKGKMKRNTAALLCNAHAHA